MQSKHDRGLKHFYQPSNNSYQFVSNQNPSKTSNVSSEVAKMEILNKMNSNKKSVIYHKLENINDDCETAPTSVQRVQPKTCCSRRSCVLLCVWSALFIFGVLLLTVFVVRVIQNGTKKTPRKLFYSRYKDSESSSEKVDILPCDDVVVKKVWHSNFDKLQTETAVRFIDVNSDGIDDPIIAFGTGVDGYNVDKIVCKIYFNGTFPCFGGALAINGKTGKEIWRHYSGHEIYAVNCNGDIDKDGIPDCLLGGRGGIFDAISGKDGHLLWSFWDKTVRSEVMNLYTAQFIRDLNSDGVMEVLQIHGGDPLALVSFILTQYKHLSLSFLISLLSTNVTLAEKIFFLKIHFQIN